MPFNVPTQPGPGAHKDPHNSGKLRPDEKCSVCESPATHLRYGRPTCKEHRL